MGQRLNIEVRINGERVANSYYHWSAYTSSALNETKKCIDFYNDYIKGKTEDPLLIAVQLLLKISSSISKKPPLPSSIPAPLISLLGMGEPGLCDESFEFMKEKYPDIDWPKAKSRNDGMVSCTEDDMNQTEDAEEGRITIYLDDETISIDVLYVYTLDDFCEMIEEEEEEPPMQIVSHLPTLYLNPFELPFDKISKLQRIFEEYPEIMFYDDNGDLAIIQTIQ